MQVAEYTEPLVQRVLEAVRCGHKVCVLLRGLPGRGKTSMACYFSDRLAAEGLSVACAAADDYMLNDAGEYEFQLDRLSFAHNECARKLAAAMAAGTDVVIQHNTNTQPWESSTLRSLATAQGYLVFVSEPQYAWATPEQIPLALRDALVSVHNVSEQKISEMRSRKTEIVPTYIGAFVTKERLLTALEQVGALDSVTRVLGPLLDKVPHMLHVTLSFIGSRPSTKHQIEIARAMNTEALVKLELLVTAIAFDPARGAFAVVSPNGLEEHYGRHDTKKQEEKDRSPHITLAANPGVSNAELNKSTVEFLHDPKFEHVQFQPPLRLDSILAGYYASSDGKFQYLTWRFESQELSDEFSRLMDSGNTRMVTFPVPEAIVGQAGYLLADLSAAGGKGRSDDQVYDRDPFLRAHLPRGLCYLVDPSGLARKILVGLSKFTGDEDDVDGHVRADKYFTAPVETTAKVLVTEKANGESAHVSMIELKGQKYFVCGSKHVHMLVRHDNPQDIVLYDAERFSYAREIATAFFNSIFSERRGVDIQLLEQELLHNHCTAVFEYEDPAHAHVVPLYEVKLKFITFARPNPENGLGSLVAYPPTEALGKMERIGLECVWSFTVGPERLEEVKHSLLTEDRFIFEGAVLYHLDAEGRSIGLVKSKNASYICSRAIREKISSFCSSVQSRVKALLSNDAISNLITTLRECKDPKERHQAVQTRLMTMLPELGKLLHADKNKVEQQLQRRFKDLTQDFVPLTEASRDSWVQTGVELAESILTHVHDAAAGHWPQMARLLERELAQDDQAVPVSQFSALSIESDDEGAAEAKADGATIDGRDVNPRVGIRRLCHQIEEAVAPHSEAEVRRQWPFVWAKHVRSSRAHPFNELRPM